MLNLFTYIPPQFIQLITDTLVDFLVKQAEKLAGEQIADKIRKLSSQSGFIAAAEKAVQRGAERFAAEYVDQDEDLVAAIGGQLADFWKNRSVQTALLTLLRRPGAWTVGEAAEVAAQFEEVLPERRNRDRVNKALTYFLRCVAEELWTLPGAKEVREVYALQFQKTTAAAASEQVVLARRQLEATTQLSAEIRQALVQLTTTMEKNLLAAPPLAILPRPRPYLKLPQPDYLNFVGREKELERLRQLLSPQDRAWQIAITGIGGVGKSALALAIAHEYCQRYAQLPPEERFEAIIWISAKEEVLTAQGREQADLPEQILRTLEDVYTAIARALEREDITSAQPEDQGRIVDRALKEQRTLLLMDNLESVKDERIKPFLRNLPAPTKAIITSREWVDVADGVHLTGLSPEEADYLVLEEAAARHVQLDAVQRQRLYSLTDGLPLPIRLAVARLASGESFLAVTRWLGDAVGDLPEYCIQGQAELANRRDPNAWKLLLACSLFDRNARAAREALGYVADLSLADRDKGLAQLQRFFLLNRTDKDRFWALPIVQRYASLQLARADNWPALIERWLEWLGQFARAREADLEINAELIQEFGVEYLNVLGAFRWCREQERWSTLVGLAPAAWRYAYIMGLFHEFREVLDITLEAARVTQDERLEGRVILQLGRLAEIQARPDQEVLELIDRAEQYALRFGNDLDLGEAWATRISILRKQARDCIDQNQTAEAQALLNQAEQWSTELFRAWGRTGNLTLKYLAAIRFSEIELERQNYDKASAWVDTAEACCATLHASRLSANLLSQRGLILYQQGQYPIAETYLLQAWQKFSELGLRRHTAFAQSRLARVYAGLGRIELARQYGEAAGEAFERLGMTWEYQRLKAFMLRLPEAA